MTTFTDLIGQVDEQLSRIFTGWNLWTTIIALSIFALIGYNTWSWRDPDTHPFLLARQSTAAPIRQPGESAVYRSLETPHGYPLRSGLGIKDDQASRWGGGRDGDLRDIWKSAVGGYIGEHGQPTGKQGRVLTIRGREEVLEHDLGMDENPRPGPGQKSRF